MKKGKVLRVARRGWLAWSAAMRVDRRRRPLDQFSVFLQGVRAGINAQRDAEKATVQR